MPNDALDAVEVSLMRTPAKARKRHDGIIHDLLNVLVRGVAEIAIVIAEPITSKVEGDSASTLELEFMLIREGLDDERRVFTGNQ